jgi:F-type H+-transporting ATPase subunit delta
VNDALARTLQAHADRAMGANELDRAIVELGALTRVVTGSDRLSRVLADPDVPSGAKRSLLDDVTAGAVLPRTLDLLVEAVSHGRTSVADLVATLNDVTVELVFIAAERSDRTTAVESGTYRATDMVQGSLELRRALSDPGADDASKDRLVVDLLRGKADDLVVELVRLVVAMDHGRDVATGLIELSRRAAARRGLVVADVRTAIELDDALRTRLADAIGRNIGHAVAPRFHVDPSIIGSVTVHVGDEVLDGSIRNRLEQARSVLVDAQ